MSHTRASLTIAVMLSTIVLAGFVSVSLTAGHPTAYQQTNGQANHHPRHAAD